MVETEVGFRLPTSAKDKTNLAWEKVREIQELCKNDRHIIFQYKGNPIHGSCQFRGWTNPENGEDETRARLDPQGLPASFKQYGFKLDEVEIRVPLKSEEELYMMIGNPLCKESPYNKPPFESYQNHQYYIANPSLNKKEEIKKLQSSQDAMNLYNDLKSINDPEGMYMIATMLGTFENEELHVTHALLSAVMTKPDEFVRVANDPKLNLKSTLLQLKKRGVIVDDRFSWKYRPVANEDGIFLGSDYDKAVEMVGGDSNLFASMSAKLKSIKEEEALVKEKEQSKKKK